MKIKLPGWEIIVFCCINISLILSYYLFAFTLLISISLFALIQSFFYFPEIKHNIPALSILLVFSLLLITGWTLLKSLILYTMFRLISKKGKNKCKLWIQNLKQKRTLKIKVLIGTFLIDILFLCIISFLHIFTAAKIINFSSSLWAYSKEYFLSGGLTLPYLTTFIIWKIQDISKKEKASNSSSP